MTVVQFLPWLLATLPTGAMADRMDRRRILIVGNWLRAAGFALLALALANGWQHVALLYTAVFIAGCAETMVDNATLAIPPRVLPREKLERANGRLFATQAVINTFIGPPAGAALFELAASAAFYCHRRLHARLQRGHRPSYGAMVELVRAIRARQGHRHQAADRVRPIWLTQEDRCLSCRTSVVACTGCRLHAHLHQHWVDDVLRRHRPHQVSGPAVDLCQPQRLAEFQLGDRTAGGATASTVCSVTPMPEPAAPVSSTVPASPPAAWPRIGPTRYARTGREQMNRL